MENIIWNKEELKKIKNIILKKSNLKMDEEGKLVQLSSPKISNGFYRFNSSLYYSVNEELEKLFYIDNKSYFEEGIFDKEYPSKIDEVLGKASQIKVDLNNKLHFGFIANISKVNPNNKEGIFIIFNEIIALYEKKISDKAHMIIDQYDNVEDAKVRLISEMNDGYTSYCEIKSMINEVFSFANGVNENELFRPLIDKLDSLIQSRLIHKMKELINKKYKEINSNQQLNVISYANHSLKKHTVRKNLKKY